MKLLLFVHTAQDVAALPIAATAIKRLGITGLWLLFSPAVLVDDAEASAKYDKDIAELDAAVEACASRRDFEGAKGYQAQLDAKRLSKVENVKNQWKTMDKAQKDAAAERVFGTFMESKPCENIRPECMDDHFDTFVDAFNAQRKKWFAEYKQGGFVMAWPTSFGEQPKRDPKVPVGATEKPTPPEAPRIPVPAPEAPAKEDGYMKVKTAKEGTRFRVWRL